MTDEQIIKAKELIKKLEEAYNAYYDTSKGMPYDIDKTLRESAICIENALAEINRQKAEIERLEADLKVKNQVLKDRELTPCPFDDDHERRTSYLHILNRKSAEIVKLEAETDRLNYLLQCYALEHGTAVDKERFLKPARAEAVKEFAERLKAQRIKPEFPWDDFTVTEGMIDDLVKEFTEGGKQ